jgi:membrane-associated phospholipid phosphatase
MVGVPLLAAGGVMEAERTPLVTELAGRPGRRSDGLSVVDRHARRMALPDLAAAPPSVITAAPVAVRRGRTAALLERLGLLGFLGIFGLVRARRSDALDLAVTVKLQRYRAPALERAMAAISWPGFPPQSRVIPAVLVAGLVVLRLPLEAVGMVGAWGTALVATCVKALMRRSRPVAGIDVRVAVAPLGGSSFPSGHTITYVGVYGFLAYLVHTLLRPVAWRRAIVGSLIGLVALVGPSRVQQGHHWLTDVTASYLLGLAYLLALTRAYRGRKARGTAETP